MNKGNAAELLAEVFGPGEAPIVVRAPGRVNLIGEHTDYNDGYVMPFAINRYTEVALRPRPDAKALVHAARFSETFSFHLPLEDPHPRGSWSDYLVGILKELASYRELSHGFEAVISGDVPLGAGLSSSASLEVALALALVRLYGIELEGLELVRLCQRAENEFVGMPCGIMDPYVVYFAKPESALLLDTRVLIHRAVPLRLGEAALLVVDSGVRRKLSGSGYANRRRECEEAAAWFARKFPDRGVRALRDVDEGMLMDSRGKIPETLWRRAAHVVRENERVLAMADALERQDLRRAGELLTASHASLRDLFEVSTPELDFLVDWGVAHGALGARLVGGGFGGVTLHLVPREEMERYVKGLERAYREAFGPSVKAWEVRPSPGAALI